MPNLGYYSIIENCLKLTNTFSLDSKIDSCGGVRKIFFYNFVPPLSNSLLFVLRDWLTRKSILP